MSILFAGGEDTSFAFIVSGGYPQLLTSVGTYTRTTYTRTGIGCYNATSTTDPPPARAQCPTFTSTSILWFHARIYSLAGTSTANQQALLFRSPDGVARILLRQTATRGQIKVSKRDSVGTITDLATSSSNISQTTITKIDIEIDYSSSPGGVNVWIDGVNVINYVGDPRTDAATQLNQFELMNIGGSNDASIWSEVIAADEDTRSMSLWTIAPVASGNTQGFIPDTVGNINEVATNDGTFVSSGSNNTISEWTTLTSPPSGTWNVRTIFQEARVQVGVTGPQHFDWVVRTASTDFTAGTSNAPITSFGNFNYQWTQNPNTSTDWLIGDIASGFNLGIKSLA